VYYYNIIGTWFSGIVTGGPRSMGETARITDDRNPNSHLRALKQRGHRYYM